MEYATPGKFSQRSGALSIDRIRKLESSLDFESWMDTSADLHTSARELIAQRMQVGKRVPQELGSSPSLCSVSPLRLRI